MDLIPIVRRLKELSIRGNFQEPEASRVDILLPSIKWTASTTGYDSQDNNNAELFTKHINICKDYFKSFIFDE